MENHQPFNKIPSPAASASWYTLDRSQKWSDWPWNKRSRHSTNSTPSQKCLKKPVVLILHCELKINVVHCFHFTIEVIESLDQAWQHIQAPQLVGKDASHRLWPLDLIHSRTSITSGTWKTLVRRACGFATLPGDRHCSAYQRNYGKSDEAPSSPSSENKRNSILNYWKSFVCRTCSMHFHQKSDVREGLSFREHICFYDGPFRGSQWFVCTIWVLGEAPAMWVRAGPARCARCSNRKLVGTAATSPIPRF